MLFLLKTYYHINNNDMQNIIMFQIISINILEHSSINTVVLILVYEHTSIFKIKRSSWHNLFCLFSGYYQIPNNS